MDTPVIWFLKLVSAHLLTDFLLQPTGWIKKRIESHFGSGYLYLHGLITAGVACLFIGYTYWIVILVILVSHTMIDGWKSYRKQNLHYFLIDQLLHLTVLAACFTSRSGLHLIYPDFGINFQMIIISGNWQLPLFS